MAVVMQPMVDVDVFDLKRWCGRPMSHYHPTTGQCPFRGAWWVILQQFPAPANDHAYGAA